MQASCCSSPRIAATGRYKIEHMHAWADRRLLLDHMQAAMTSNAGAVLCLLLFSAGQLAAASKSFGGGGGGAGGYGEEAGGHQHHEEPGLTPEEVETINDNYKAPEKAWVYFGLGDESSTPAAPSKSSPVSNNYKAPEKAWFYAPKDESPTPAAPSKASPVQKAWSLYAPEDESPTPAAPSKATPVQKAWVYGPKDESPTPATPSKSSSSSAPSTGGKASSTSASSSTKNKGYDGSGTPSSSSTTPASSGKASASGGSGQQGGTPSSYTTPASSGKASASASASGGSGQQGGTPSSSTTPASGGSSSATPAAGGGYGLDPAGEPEYGLNQKAIDDILKEHNVFRAKEHVPPLSWNATLAKFSQQYAETLKGTCKMVHSTSPYGENLMLGEGGGITWKTTVDQWSEEKKSYHYGSNSCDAGKMCGHYTAVVWNGTTTVGCGRVKCNNGDTMIMCSYWPPGNYDGARPY